MSTKPPSSRSAQQEFGRQAASYARSAAPGSSLGVFQEYAALGRYQRALDIGTGPGFSAFPLAEYAALVVASDVAPQMLAEAKRLLAERKVTNVALARVEAEHLPFASASVDLVSCRAAAHHFYDLPQAIGEIRRVLKPGAPFLLSDIAAPEDEAIAAWMNEVERGRDPSHQCNRSPLEWQRLLEGTGFQVTHLTLLPLAMEFDRWLQVAGTPERQVRALRRAFLSAPPAVAAAFDIRPQGEAIAFRFDSVVLRAVKG